MAPPLCSIDRNGARTNVPDRRPLATGSCIPPRVVACGKAPRFARRTVLRGAMATAAAIAPFLVGGRTSADTGDANPPDLPSALTGRVLAALSGDRLRLDRGPPIRLADVEAPWRPPDGAADLAWPLAEEAARRLADRVLGAEATVLAADLLPDRWGFLVAHIAFGPTAAWLNADRVAAGYARVVPTADSDFFTVRRLQTLEDAARTADRGLWRNAFYRVQSLEDLPHGPEGYRLFEGRILDAADVDDRIYLNFGADWRTDTTLAIAPERVAAFVAAGLPPLQLPGRAVRVRGYVRRYAGPRVDLVHPGQIELLDPA